MHLRWYPYTLQLRHTFTIATYSRTSTPAMMVELEHDGITGYGEASMPPYLGETQESVGTFLSKVDLARYDSPFLLENILSDIDRIATGNHAAKASIDIALHDWVGKKLGHPLHIILGLSPENTPHSSFTIGIDTVDVVKQKVREAPAGRVLKVKLGSSNDRDIVDAIREVTSVPIRVDANQGWADREKALHMIKWLAACNVEFIEQPMPKDRLDDMAWLKERSPLPLIADESIARLVDVPRISGAFHGINIKLMKCTGIREAYKMILVARGLGLKVMLGCMTETSCAISAAAQLSPLVDWADLDGAELISNDLFDGATMDGGRVKIPTRPGIGVLPTK